MTEERKIELYQNRFEEWLPRLKSGAVLWDGTHRESFQLQDGEYFRRAWSPISVARSQLPKAWWVSNFGNVITMKFTTPRIIVFTATSAIGRPRQKTSFDGRSKSISLEAVRFLVFGGRAWHDSWVAVCERGLDAFHGADPHCFHHLYGYDASLSRQANSDQDKIVLIPVWLNRLLHSWDDLNNDWIKARTEPVTDIDIFKKLEKREEKLKKRTQDKIGIPVEIVLKETDVNGVTVKYLDLWQII